MRFVTGEVVEGVASAPPELVDLLERPLIGYLATQRPDGSLQNNPMWYSFDGERLQLSHTRARQKFRNLEFNPSMSLSIADPDNTFRYVEVRGRVTGVEVDQDAQFHRDLRVRYGMDPDPVPDAADRVVITVTPTFIGGRDMDDPTAG